jgi:hypothetical protein
MAVLFAYVPATSDGCTVMAEPQRGNKVACFCDCGCGNFAADDFCTSCYDVCLAPCDRCGLRVGGCLDQGDEFPVCEK